MKDQFITFVFADETTGSYSTLTKPHENDDPEVDTAPNLRYFVAMFTGNSAEQSMNAALKHIEERQKKEPIDFKKIKEANRKKAEGSWVSYPDGSKILFVPQ